ncbi:MAG: hypothetical protein BV458_09565 [Thermoplasmata archaeon M9B2D]|nr:MAG: hypothetical protein BV458_09565 [Thermoplasmata archaeon M9B2D]
MPVKRTNHLRTQNHGLAELTATLLLLGLLVITFVAITYMLFSAPQGSPTPVATITGRLVDNNLILEHTGGEPIDLNASVGIAFGSTQLQIQAYDYVDTNTKKDGLWSFGEQVIYPLYMHPEYLESQQIEVMILNNEPASSIMFCSAVIEPLSDLSVEVTVDPQSPVIGTPVTFTITVHNNGNINVSDIKIHFPLPVGFTFIGYTATSGAYDNSTGLWENIDTIQPGESAVLTMTVIVGQVNPDKMTQILILLDGSGSIRKQDLDKIRNGFVTAIGNESIFPQDGYVELTVILFGGNAGQLTCKVVLNPTVVTNETIDSVLSTLNTITTMPGFASTSCGFLLGCDTVTASSIFTTANRHMVLLITDGKASLICNIDGDYDADSPQGMDPDTAAIVARDYLIDQFGMNPMDDEIDVLAVHITDETAYDWFKDEVVWPQPGYFAPPFHTELPLQGFVCNATDWDQFPNVFKNIMTNALNRVKISANIVQASATDPKKVNNNDGVYIVPQSL